MKILYHHRTNGDGAEGIHVAEIIAALQRLGHEVPLICPNSARRPPGLAQAAPRSARNRRPTRLPKLTKQTAEIAYNSVSYGRARRGISQHKPDFIYERYSPFNFGGVLAARHCRVPLILEVNATYAGDFGCRFPVYFPGVLRRTEQYVLQQATGIVVVSQVLKSCVMKRQVPAHRIQVTPNAINPEKVAAVDAPQSRVAVRSRLGLGDSVVVGFVGSLRTWHGIDFFAEAIPQIAQRAPQARFLIVGTGEFESELRSIVEKRNLSHCVHLAGAVPHDQVFDYIAAMDIGVMPDSNQFGSPMKILEYMAMGCVPVAPSLGPIQEIVEENVTGKLFAQRHLPSFVDAIVGLCQDDESRTGIAQNAIAYVMRERTWDRNAAEIVDLFLSTQRGM